MYLLEILVIDKNFQLPPASQLPSVNSLITKEATLPVVQRVSSISMANLTKTVWPSFVNGTNSCFLQADDRIAMRLWACELMAAFLAASEDAEEEEEKAALPDVAAEIPGETESRFAESNLSTESSFSSDSLIVYFRSNVSKSY